jgi:hypothetical protein
MKINKCGGTRRNKNNEKKRRKHTEPHENIKNKYKIINATKENTK